MIKWVVTCCLGGDKLHAPNWIMVVSVKQLRYSITMSRSPLHWLVGRKTHRHKGNFQKLSCLPSSFRLAEAALVFWKHEVCRTPSSHTTEQYFSLLVELTLSFWWQKAVHSGRGTREGFFSTQIPNWRGLWMQDQHGSFYHYVPKTKSA